jgi:hypothetical protein
MFVDHSRSSRSGHVGHALVAYSTGGILAFYANCSDDYDGHSAIGWMELKRSADGGRTWSDATVLRYSRDTFDAGRGQSVFCEKAVLTSDGTIVLFCLVCDISAGKILRSSSWEPYLVPTCIRSADGGRTWTVPVEVSLERGRVYDAIYRDGTILALVSCNDCADGFLGSSPDHVYSLYASEDDGGSFARRSVLPFDPIGRAYGTMETLPDGRLIASIYNKNDEYRLDRATSQDQGRTWSDVDRAYFVKKIRNPQMVSAGGVYFLHGRSGSYGDASGNLVLYSSLDGLTWDAGTYLRMREAGSGAYSNGLVVGTPGTRRGHRLLIQASHAYDKSKTNVLHWWVEGIHRGAQA